MGRPEQNRLLPKGRAGLPGLKERAHDTGRVGRSVGRGDECGPGAGASLRAEVLRETRTSSAKGGIGGGQNGLKRAIVLRQRDDPRGRCKVSWKVENVA